MISKFARAALGPFYLVAGALHFLRPRMYEAIMPAWLPAHHELVLASGVAEIAGGLAVLHPRTRRAGGLWLVATLLGVFPANVDMAVRAERYANIPEAALWARLPLQGLLIWWAWAATRDQTSASTAARRRPSMGRAGTRLRSS